MVDNTSPPFHQHDVKYESNIPDKIANLVLLSIEKRIVIGCWEMANCESKMKMYTTGHDAKRIQSYVADIEETFADATTNADGSDKADGLDAPNYSKTQLPTVPFPDMNYIDNPDLHDMILMMCALRVEMCTSESRDSVTYISAADRTRVRAMMDDLKIKAAELTTDPGMDAPETNVVEVEANPTRR